MFLSVSLATGVRGIDGDFVVPNTVSRTGEFSFRCGDPRRRGNPEFWGDWMVTPWLGDCLTEDSIFGGVAILLLLSPKFPGLRGWRGDHAAMTSGSRMDVMSESELRRCFFFGTGMVLVGVPSPMLFSVEILRCALPGRVLGSFCVIESDVEGLSRDTGLNGGSIRVSISVDLDLPREALERLVGCEWPSPGLLAFLLRVRQIDATFDSDSLLLFSRLKVLIPNFFFKDDAFELRDPVFIDRVLVKDPVADLVLLSWSSCPETSCVPSAIAKG